MSATMTPGAHGKLYHFTDPAKDRFAALLKDDPTSAEEFRSTLRNYTRAYAFLAQVIPYHDAELERLYLYGKALLQRLTRTHDGGVDLGSVDLSHLRIVKTGTSDVSLGEDGEEQIVPGFTGGGRGSQTTPELALIDQVIAAINERLGGNLTDADTVWVQQSFEYAAEDPQIQQAAQANTEDNFAYVFNPAFQGLVLDRHDANAEPHQPRLQGRRNHRLLHRAGTTGRLRDGPRRGLSNRSEQVTGADTPVVALMCSCRRMRTSRTTPSMRLSRP